MSETKNRNEYFKQYREANRDKLNAYQRDYNKRNKLKNYKRLAAYYQRKAEELERLEGNKDEENINSGDEP